MSQQSTDVARHLIGTGQPLTGEIVPAMERVTVPDTVPTSHTPAPASIRLPGTVPAAQPTAWEWTAGPAPINVTIPAAPTTPATIQRHGSARGGVPISVLLSLATTLTGAAWAALSDSSTHPAAIEAIITAALGLVATIGTAAAAIRREGQS